MESLPKKKTSDAAREPFVSGLPGPEDEFKKDEMNLKEIFDAAQQSVKKKKRAKPYERSQEQIDAYRERAKKQFPDG